MSWARYDDELSMNRKVGHLRGRGVDGIAALGFHLLANTYCRHNGTKGVVDNHVPDLLCGKLGKKLAKILEEVGMFDARPEGGWEIHDYAEFHDPNDPDPDKSASERKRELSEIRRAAGSKGGQRAAANRASKPPSKASSKPVAELLANGVANGVAKEQQSPTPDPVPNKQVTDTSTSVDTPTSGGESDLQRINAVADQYARIALERAHNIANPDAYLRTAPMSAMKHPDISRYLQRWPTAPADAIAAWLHGEKHSMSYYHDTQDDEVATVHHLHGEPA